MVTLTGYGQFDPSATDIVFRPVPLGSIANDPAPPLPQPAHDSTAIISMPPANGRSLVMASQGDDGAARQDAMTRYREAIAAIEGQEGIFAQALFENLSGLAMQYEKQGEYGRALAEYERAEYIDRINNGLYTPAQIATSERVIGLLEKLNRFDDVGKRLDNYVYMHEKLYGLDSIDIVDALDRQADWQFRAFRMSMRQQPVDAGMVSYINGLAMDSGPQGILQKTQDTWLRAIRLLVENHAWNNPMLPVLEDKLLETYVAHASLGRMLYGNNRPYGQPGNSFSAIDGSASADIEYMNFSNGVNVFHRKLHYLKQADTFAVIDYADTLVELGDWYMLFGNRQDALDTYAQAREVMRENDVPAPHQAKLLHPQVPVSLTGALVAGHAPQPAGNAHSGWIDLEYTLNRNGRVGKIKMTGASENTGKDVTNQLLRQVRNTQFRPYLRDSDEGDNEQLALRYYYQY